MVFVGAHVPAGNQLRHLRHGIAIVGIRAPRKGRHLEKHALGTEIVALFHHRSQHLVDGVGAGEPNRGRCGRHAGAHKATDRDASLRKCAQEVVGELVAATVKERRERSCLIVPTPSASQGRRVLHRGIEHHIAHNFSHTVSPQLFDDGAQIVVCEERIHAAANVNVAHSTRIVGFAAGLEGGGETIVGTEQIECGDRRDHLHVGGGTQALVQSVGVECAVVGEIIDTDSHLRPIEEGVFQQGVETAHNGAGEKVGRSLCRGITRGIDGGSGPHRVDHRPGGDGKCGGNMGRCAGHTEDEERKSEETEKKRSGHGRNKRKDWVLRGAKPKKAFETSVGFAMFPHWFQMLWRKDS